eukprot:1391892-Amorphochlora_amoeboformis.AAC.1
MMGAAYHRSSQPRLGAGKVVFGAFAVISAICYIASNTGAPELARAPGTLGGMALSEPSDVAWCIRGVEG